MEPEARPKTPRFHVLSNLSCSAFVPSRENPGPGRHQVPHSGIPCTVPSTASAHSRCSLSLWEWMDMNFPQENQKHTLNGSPSLLLTAGCGSFICEWKQAYAEAVDTVGRGPAWRLNSEKPSVPGPCSFSAFSAKPIHSFSFFPSLSSP